MFIVRLLLLCFALYTTLFLLEFTAAVYHSMSPTAFLVYVLAALLPVPVFAYRIFLLMPTLAHVSCVGCFRKKLVVNRVVRDMKTKRALKALNVLYQMQVGRDDVSHKDRLP